MATEQVLVLGGGIGGVVAARELRRRLPSDVSVQLVDRADVHLFAPSLLWILTGQRSPDQITAPLERLNRHGVEVIQGGVAELRAEDGAVVLDDGRVLHAGHIVVALGAELAPEAVPGLADSGSDLYTADGLFEFRSALARFDGDRIALVIASVPFKCPAAPYEAALLVDAELRRLGKRERVDLALHAAEPAPMGVTGPAVSSAVSGMLEQREIAYHPNRPLESVDPNTRELRFTDGSRAAFDLLGFVSPHRAPAALAGSGLFENGDWVSVDRHTLETRVPGVYAIGDVTSIPLAMGKPLPKAGVFAHEQAQVVAANISDSIAGTEGSARFHGPGSCFLEVGNGRAAFARGNFYTEPTPTVRMRGPSPIWHWAKVAFEKRWFRRWF